MNDLAIFVFMIVSLMCVAVFALPVLWLIFQLIVRPILWIWFSVFPQEHIFSEDDLPL